VPDVDAVQWATVLDLGPQLLVGGRGLIPVPLQGGLLHLSDGGSIGPAASAPVVGAGSLALALEVFFCPSSG
jgi:hypothetical protein